ncbi:MAG: hypothetical protein U0105_26755 [Candidatus Obscuribacterales bacterium]
MEGELFASDEFKRDYKNYLDEWLTLGQPSDEYYLERVRDGIISLYSQLDIEHVQLIVCSGPLQFTVFPALVEMMLKLGPEKAAQFKFERLDLETPDVRQEWSGFWQDALEQIDWDVAQNAKPELGALLDSRVEQAVIKPLISRLIAEVDVDLETEDHQELQKRFQASLHMMCRRFKSAMVFNRANRGPLWLALIRRIPLQYRSLLGKEVDDPPKAVRTRTGQLVHRPEPPLHPNKLHGHLTGSFDWTWLSSIDFAKTYLRCRIPDELSTKVDMWWHLVSGAIGYLFFENCCFIYLRPLEAHFDQDGRLHHESRAAAEFADGSKFFFWHGVEVDDYIITNPERLKVKLIERERNIETRRVMIERFGFENFVRLAVMRKIHSDEYGSLYRKELRHDEPLLIVRVTNATPEADGTFKDYFLRVPPHIETAKEAVAWTFGLTEREYAPEQES